MRKLPEGIRDKQDKSKTLTIQTQKNYAVYNCAYYNSLWSMNGILIKHQSNRQKHGIDFADVVSVFTDDFAITVMDEHPDEERFVTIGVDALGRFIVVVYTWRSETCIRLISARKATNRERQQYEEET